MVDQKEDKQQDLIAWLADLSEGAIQRLAEAPGADRVMSALKGLGERVDDLQKQTRGFAEMEKRLSALEKRVDSLSKPKPKPARKRKPASAARPPKTDPTPKKP